MVFTLLSIIMQQKKFFLIAPSVITFKGMSVL